MQDDLALYYSITNLEICHPTLNDLIAPINYAQLENHALTQKQYVIPSSLSLTN